MDATILDKPVNSLEGFQKLNKLQLEILDEAKKIAKNEVSSCYVLVELTRDLIAAERLML